MHGLVDFPWPISFRPVLRPRFHRTSARVLILLCLFTLQAQLLASSTLVCKHARTGGATLTCPLHMGASAATGTDKVDSLLDCQKCALGVFLGCCHQLVSVYLPSPAPISHVKSARGPDHFYHFVPDRSIRPPISLQG